MEGTFATVDVACLSPVPDYVVEVFKLVVSLRAMVLDIGGAVSRGYSGERSSSDVDGVWMERNLKESNLY